MSVQRHCCRERACKVSTQIKNERGESCLNAARDEMKKKAGVAPCEVGDKEGDRVRRSNRVRDNHTIPLKLIISFLVLE